MTQFSRILKVAQKFFPKLSVKYKNTSTLMNILGKILFFNKNFMHSYTTTIGSAVYFPNQHLTDKAPSTSGVILLHELVHLYDYKDNHLLFIFLYFFPQSLFILGLPLLLINWHFIFILSLFLLPLPAYFRMNYEKRAYFISLYIYHQLSNKYHFKENIQHQMEFFLKQFKGSDYYFMWPFKNLEKEFLVALEKIKQNHRPFEEEKLFNIIDRMINEI